MSATKEELIGRLKSLTCKFNPMDIPSKATQDEIREVGKDLDRIGGFQAMQGAYYEAKAENRYCSVVQAYWDGVGSWRW